MDYSSTYRLAQDIRDSEEYKTYHGLKESVMADETTAALITASVMLGGVVGGATEEQRREAMEEMRKLGGKLHRTGKEERNILLNQTLKTLGYTGSAAAEIKDAIQTIYSTTQDWGGHGGRHGGGRGGPPPPPR